MIEVSVIIPVYNRDIELKRAIQSVLAQTIQNFEIIIVDDCSEINIKKIVADFLDSRLSYFRLDVKGNGNVCRNVGIKKAKGNYIAMLDSDDEWLKTHLETQIENLKTLEVDGVFGSIIIDNGDAKKYVPSRSFYENETMANYLLLGGLAQTSTHLYKSETVKSVLWDEALYRNQDLDFCIRYSDQFNFVPVLQFTTIIHWKKGEKRNEHLESNMHFSKKHQSRFTPEAYHKFHRHIYLQIVHRQDVSNNIKRFFLNNSTRYIKSCSLTDYFTTHAIGKNNLQKLFLRIKFSTKLLFS
jgi:glycosyltransferase involved in cell wall biosynthesis